MSLLSQGRGAVEPVKTAFQELARGVLYLNQVPETVVGLTDLPLDSRHVVLI